MDTVIMLRADYGKQSLEIIDYPPDYVAIRETIGDAVAETQLEGDIIALTASSESEQILRIWRDIAFTGDTMLITARTADGMHRSLTAEEINQYLKEFGGF